MNKFDITEYEWSDSDTFTARADDTEVFVWRNIGGVRLTIEDARALCQHFFGIDPEKVGREG